MHPPEESLKREQLFVQWLDSIRTDASELWLLGDVFDYWFEYNKVVPRGFTRFLGKLATLHDQGVDIHLIPGNHDIWVFNYLPQEVGLKVHRKEMIRTWNNHRFLLGHGDGLYHKDIPYRLLQSIFKNRLMQWFYARVHPNGSTTFAHWWSRRSRQKHGTFGEFLGPDQEHQVQYARKKLLEDPTIEYFLFGHRHIAYDIRIGDRSRVVCLGDWIGNFTYGVFDGEKFELKKFQADQGEIHRFD
jgi:UDP-2,3-diacylglucosamine hydrolase